MQTLSQYSIAGWVSLADAFFGSVPVNGESLNS